MRHFPISTLCVLVILMITVISCKPEHEHPEEKHNPHKTDVTLSRDTISAAQFTAWTTAWATHGSAFNDTSLVRYYSLPMVDIIELVGEQAVGTRFYNGLESLTTGGYVAHLIVCGTDRSGAIVGNYYDFSSPCPKSCNE